MLVTFSYDNQYLASAPADDDVKIRDTVTGTCLQTIQGHMRIKGIGFWLNHQEFALGSSDYAVKIWDVATGRCLEKFDMGGPCFHIRFETTGLYLYSVSDINIKRLPLDTTLPTILRQGHGLHLDKMWVMWNSDNLLWLPSEYRPPEHRTRSWSMLGSSMAIGCGTGRVLIFTFKLDEY